MHPPSETEKALYHKLQDAAQAIKLLDRVAQATPQLKERQKLHWYAVQVAENAQKLAAATK
jgi:hypothetical protein